MFCPGYYISEDFSTAWTSIAARGLALLDLEFWSATNEVLGLIPPPNGLGQMKEVKIEEMMADIATSPIF